MATIYRLEEHCVDHFQPRLSWVGRAKLRDFLDHTKMYDEGRYPNDVPNLKIPFLPGEPLDTLFCAVQVADYNKRKVLFRQTLHSSLNFERQEGKVMIYGYQSGTPYRTGNGETAVETQEISDESDQEAIKQMLLRTLGQREVEFIK